MRQAQRHTLRATLRPAQNALAIRADLPYHSLALREKRNRRGNRFIASGGTTAYQRRYFCTLTTEVQANNISSPYMGQNQRQRSALAGSQMHLFSTR